MTPTIEEVTRVAEEFGAKLNYRQFNFSEEKYLHGFETLGQLQAFAQHYIEVGRKKALDASQDATHLCRYCKLPYKPTGWNEDCPACGCDGTDKWIAIRNNTGE